jgi:hypothetical protein
LKIKVGFLFLITGENDSALTPRHKLDNPRQSGCRFHGKADGDSKVIRMRIPGNPDNDSIPKRIS